MSLIDRQGRLLGKVNILDLGAGLVILLVLIGIFIVPGPTGSVAQIANNQPIEVDLLVRGLAVNNIDQLFADFKQKPKANVIIRSAPAGTVTIQTARELERTIGVPQPDGTVKALRDPRPEVAIIRDLIISVVGEGQVTNEGVVLSKQKVSIGTSIELNGPGYNFNGTVIEVRS